MKHRGFKLKAKCCSHLRKGETSRIRQSGAMFHPVEEFPHVGATSLIWAKSTMFHPNLCHGFGTFSRMMTSTGCNISEMSSNPPSGRETSTGYNPKRLKTEDTDQSSTGCNISIFRQPETSGLLNRVHWIASPWRPPEVLERLEIRGDPVMGPFKRG